MLMGSAARNLRDAVTTQAALDQVNWALSGEALGSSQCIAFVLGIAVHR